MEFSDKYYSMKNSLVSVIVPVFNVAPYLKEALESIINQTYRKLEIIVINDGSTDGSREICDKYAEQDSRIHVIHQENRGLSVARNTGLDQSTGEVIAFLDPDDAFCPNMIEKLLEAMIEYQADIIVCSFSLHEVSGKMNKEATEKPEYWLCDQKEALRSIYHGKIDTAAWNRLYKKSIWDEIRFPEGRVYEGTYTVFDIFSRADRVVITNEKLVMHRIRSGSICRTVSLKNIGDAVYSRNHYISFIEQHVPDIFSQSELQSAIQNKVASMIVQYLQCFIRNAPLKKERSKVRTLVKNEKSNLCYCNHVIRTGYYAALFLPRICLILYLAYQTLRKKA